MAQRRRTSGTMVIGLGRFGAAVAGTLDRMGHEVLAVEKDRKKVQHFTGLIPIVEADAADPDALEQTGVTEFSSVVVGVGSSVESSVMITANLVDMGIESIWAKATSREHGRILERIGSHHVIYPEFDAGQRTAHLVGTQLLDYIEMDKDEFAVAKMRPPRELDGFMLSESRVRTRYGVTVVGKLHHGEPFEYATPATIIERNDIIIVSGSAEQIADFAKRPR